MVESKDQSMTVHYLTFNKRGTHVIISSQHGFTIYELDRLGDMTKNKLVATTKIEGGVKQAEFLYSTLYDVTHS